MPNNPVTSCHTLKELYECVRGRPDNQAFAVHYPDGSVDTGLISEEALKASLRAHDNAFLQQPVGVSFE